MPTFQFDEKERNFSFYVLWKGMKMFSNGPVSVIMADHATKSENAEDLKEVDLGSFNNMEEFKAGKDFNLPQGGTLNVVYKKVFWFIYGIEVTLNGQKIKGSQIEQ